MSKPAKIKLTFIKGQTFRKPLRSGAYPYPVVLRGDVIYNKLTGRPAPLGDLIPTDFTGCTARMHLRAELEDATILLEFTTENGRIAPLGMDGEISLYASDAETTALPGESGVWDLEIVHPGGDVTRFAQGSATFSPEVTRE